MIEDFKTRNNTNHPVNESLETTYEGGTFFSHLHKILQKANLYMAPLIGLLAIMKHCAPTLLALGGTCANNVEMNVENILPFAFSFGIGGPKIKCKVKVSLKLCIQFYF